MTVKYRSSESYEYFTTKVCVEFWLEDSHAFIRLVILVSRLELLMLNQIHEF